MRQRAGVLWALGLGLAPVTAIAQSVEFFQGPVVSSGRVVGLGGAYVAVAEGADGHLLNPAAFAVRPAYARFDDFDWDVAFSWLSLGGGGQDVDQSGIRGFSDGTLLDVGGHLAFGRHGYGVHLRIHNYLLDALGPDGAPAEARAKFAQVFGSVGYAFAAYDGQLTVGGALTVVSTTVGPEVLDDGLAKDAQEFSVRGGGLLLGLLWAPDDAPYRLGMTWRSHVIGEEVRGQSAVPGVPTPERVVAPAELAVGFAWMFGPRPFNPVADFGDWVATGRPRPDPTLPRRYVMLAADAVLTGPADADTVGTQGLLAGRPVPVGQSPTLGLRLGAESEILADLLRLRAGSYYEPNRHGGAGRWHGTGGVDWHLGELVWDWRLTGAIDGARGFFNWGLGLGFWH